MIARILLVGFRLFLGLVFFYSGWMKLIEPVENFMGSIAAYQLIPPVLIPAVAYIFPWFEFLFGGYVIFGYAPKISCFVLAFLSLALAGVILVSGSLLGAGSQSCGCFGEGGLQVSTRQIFFIDLANILIGIRLAFIPEHPLSLDAWLRKA